MGDGYRTGEGAGGAARPLTGYHRTDAAMIALAMAHIEPDHIALAALLAVMVSPFVWMVHG